MKPRMRRAAWAASAVLVAAGILSIIVFFVVIVRQEVVCVDGCDLPFPYVLYAGLVMTLVGCMLGVVLSALKRRKVESHPLPAVSPGTQARR